MDVPLGTPLEPLPQLTISIVVAQNHAHPHLNT